jgi:polyisoprenoid-binding protein YceI
MSIDSSIDTDQLSTLPLAPGEYDLDPTHSGVFFQVRHLGLSNVRGTFKRFDAHLSIGDDLDSIAVTATVDMASVDTNQPDRDQHLLSTDFFNATEHPEMSFRSTALRNVGGTGYELDGDLTINGVTNPITLDVEFNGTDVHPGDGRVHVGFTASAEVRRSAFGVDLNMPLGMGKMALGEKVKVDIDLQFIAP